METLKIQKMFSDVKTPEKKNLTDSGFDIYAYSFKKYYQNHGSNGERCNEGKILESMIKDKTIIMGYLDRILIGAGLKATVGPGYEIQIRPRSGLALDQGLTVLNTPGTVDETYRDELGIIIVNLSRKTQELKLGTRIAQMVVVPISLLTIELVDKMPDTNRGGGFGSSGI